MFLSAVNKLSFSQCEPLPAPPATTCFLGTRCARLSAVSRFFQPNISHRGRLARGVIGALCLIAGIIVVDYVLWLGLVLVVAGLFAMFEAVARWCVVRACGIKTKV